MLIDSFHITCKKTRTKFSYLLALGEGLLADTVCQLSEKSHNNNVSYFHYLTHLYYIY